MAFFRICRPDLTWNWGNGGGGGGGWAGAGGGGGLGKGAGGVWPGEPDSMVPGDSRAEAGAAAAPSSGSGPGPRHAPPGGEVCSGLEPAAPPRPGSRLGGSRGPVGPAVRRGRPPALLPPPGDVRSGERGTAGPGRGGIAAPRSSSPGAAAASQAARRPGLVLKGEDRGWGLGGRRRRGHGGGVGLKGEDVQRRESSGTWLAGTASRRSGREQGEILILNQGQAKGRGSATEKQQDNSNKICSSPAARI